MPRMRRLVAVRIYCNAFGMKLRRRQPYDHQFRRQKPIGNSIVDFYCPSAYRCVRRLKRPVFFRHA
ncbi:MAG: DUF559 domain-containing protein [Deltaproteobacteria bacterium]|nr:DUF559 domain-containing protein [Deltaproteobacteria bacterium]